MPVIPQLMQASMLVTMSPSFLFQQATPRNKSAPLLYYLAFLARSSSTTLFATLGAGVPPPPGSSVWSCPFALITMPHVLSGPTSCLQTCCSSNARLIQGSLSTSSIVALFLGSISSIRPMICLDSRGSNLNNRQGPLITGGGLSLSGSAPSATLRNRSLGSDRLWCALSSPSWLLSRREVGSDCAG